MLLQAYYQSGNGSGTVKETFFVEDQVQQIVVNWLGKKKNINISAIDPADHEYEAFTMKEYETDLLADGLLYSKTIENPSPGLWKVKVESYDGPYMLNIQYRSPVNRDHKIDTAVSDAIEIMYTGKNEFSDPDQTKLDILIEFISPRKRRARRVHVERINDGHKVVIPPFADGVYNLTIQLIGKTKGGYPFQRTIFESLYTRKKRYSKKIR